MARRTLLAVPILLAILASVALAQQPSRRVRVRARPIQQQIAEPEAEARSAENPGQVHYYAVQAPQEVEEEPEAVVVVQPRARNPNYYGNQLARADEELRVQPRPASRAINQISPRQKDHVKQPPVQTVRNYNTINDDGSFTFGYEAADGSFKEETRGVDCVVRGKYGYIDPDGNKREFTYVSGNPCDPNNPDPEEDDRELEDDSGEENVPVRPSIRRPTPAPRPRPQAPAQPVFQNNYIHGERIRANPNQVPITPRPAPKATTYRPRIQNYPVVPAVTESPKELQSFYTASPVPVSPTRGFAAIQATTPTSVDFDVELKKFQLEAGAPVSKSRPASQNVIQTQRFVDRPAVTPTRAGPTPRPLAAATPSNGINPVYSSQLVYDPSTGQYNTVLYQNLPKGQGDFQLNHRLQSFVQPQQHHQQPFRQQSVYVNPQTYQPVQAVPTQAPTQAPTVLPAAAPAPSRFGPQLFSQSPVAANSPSQSFYYINPNLRGQYSTGQIDAFLRGHNIQF